jgi:hypothetical protein
VGLGTLDTTADAAVIAGAQTQASCCDAPRDTGPSIAMGAADLPRLVVGRLEGRLK